MISPKKLVKMARKWQKAVAIKRKRISYERDHGDVYSSASTSSSSVVDKGHFVVYTADQRRFVFPILYLNTEIFRDLLRLSEEEFGLPSDGPITLPFGAVFMDYVVSLLQRHATTEIQKALLVSIANSKCSMPSSIDQEKPFQHLIVCSF
ncbi:hypothetical protein RHMOL_Rhmol08G0163100 [Rhododendron molle]|uniref:Uncharacterized protein n=1 Tax=Rhododendron molle TaxID=49168 RepID=A0ACC0MR08_RHOML|nr:hypothetical protein RHMOL_Rhmol08G0163100 [Rhododendron molle]